MFGKGGELEGLIQRCSFGKGPVPPGNDQLVMLHYAGHRIKPWVPGAPEVTGMSGQNMMPSLSSGGYSSATSEAATAYGGWACTIALYALFFVDREMDAVLA